VDPAVDGEDCEHDCESCTIKLPPKFSIDEDEKLYGFVKGWATHMLVATGKTDWVRDVEDEKGSVMEAVGKSGVKPSNGRLMLSASNIPLPSEHHQNDLPAKDQPTTILLLPAFTIIEHVTPASVPELIEHYVSTAPTNTSPISEPPSADGTSSLAPPIPTPSNLITRPCPHKYLLLLCSQKTRDARCGQSAPLLRREFERHLRPLGLYRDLQDERPGGVGIYFISHVGGHKFSANLMVYRKGENGEAAQCIWLARVRPEHCEGIVKYTVLQGKVVKPETQLRGGFDRKKGLVSW